MNAPSESSNTTPTGGEPSRASGTWARVARRLGQSWSWLKWLVGLGVLVWLYRQNAESLAQIAAAPKDWRFAGLAFALVGISNLIMFGRWYLLVRAQSFSFQFRDAVRYGFVGMAANFVLPGTIGGDVFKAALLARDQVSRRAAAAATVVLDRLLGILGMFLVGTVGTIVPHDFPDSPAVTANSTLLWTVSLAGLTMTCLMLVPATTGWETFRNLRRIPLVGQILGELADALKLYQSKPRAVLAALGLALVSNSGMILGLYCASRAMRPPWIPSLAAHFYFRPSSEIFGGASMIPGGIGALEFAIREAYVLLNPGAVTAAAAAAAGFSAAIAFRVLTVCVAMIGFTCYLASRREISQVMAE